MAKSSRRKRAAWGALTRVGPSTWRLRYWAEGADGYRRRSKTIRNSTRRDAEKVRAELMLAHGDDAPCPTVGEAWEQWALPELTQRTEASDLSPRTLTAYRRSWESVVSPRWAGVPCDGVRPLDVQQWLSQLLYSQAKRALQVLSMTLDRAVRYGVCDRNAARERYLMPSKGTVARRDTGVWTLDELGVVWRAVLDGAPWMEPSFLVAAFGGARVSESLGVVAGEVGRMDVGGVPLALVPIVRQVTKEDGVTDRLKTEGSRRVAVVPGRAAERITSIASALPPDWPLTNDGLGGFQSRDRLNRAWNRDVLPLLPQDQRHLYQSLRNSWQTNCRWTLGMQPWVTERLMGHTGEGVTARHYDRPQVEMLARAMAEAYAANRYDASWTWAG